MAYQIIQGFFCVRYPNLDFGWKKTIDGKSFISSADSCGSNDAHCLHPEAVSADVNSLTQSSVDCPSPCKEGPAQPGEVAHTKVNGTALVNCDSTLDEHLHQRINCQGFLPDMELQMANSIQSTTSVPVQPSHSMKKAIPSPPQPLDECTQGRTSHHINEATSASSKAKQGPGATATPLDPAAAPQSRAPTGDSPKSLGPNPGLILQALTLSNASDGFNLERLEMLGDSFLKHAITTYLFCTYPDAHEGRLSYMRSKKVRDHFSWIYKRKDGVF